MLLLLDFSILLLIYSSVTSVHGKRSSPEGVFLGIFVVAWLAFVDLFDLLCRTLTD